MTRRRSGSGGSALSALGLAAGFAAGAAGGLAVATAPAFATGGAGVLPSTGSAIFPLSDLSINYESRLCSNRRFRLRFGIQTLIFPQAPSCQGEFPIRFAVRDVCVVRILDRATQLPPSTWVRRAKPWLGVTPGRGERFCRRRRRARSARSLLRLRAAGAAMRPGAESFVARASRKEFSSPPETSRGAPSANL